MKCEFSPFSPSIWLRCLIPIAVIGLALVVRIMLLGGIGAAIPYLTFYPAVMIAAVIGGIVSGSIATILSAVLAAYYFMEPIGQFGIENHRDVLGLITFMAGNIVMVAIGELVIRKQNNLRRQSIELENINARLNLEISERKKIEIALKESEEDLLITLISIGDAVIATDVLGRITRMNPTAQRLTAWSINEALGHPLTEVFRIVNSQTLEPADDPVRRVLETGNIVGLANHTVLISREGKEYQIADSAAPIHSPLGEIVGVVLVFSDVTEKYTVIERLAESEERFRALANTGQALIWTSGLDKLCDYFNLPWLAFTGQTLEHELGNGWLDGVHPDDIAGCIKIYIDSFDMREPFGMVYRLRRYDGEYRWIQDNGSPRFDIKGDFLGYIGHCLDITDRKVLEDELLLAKNNAESANRSKNEFLANMSHEVRTPLNGILGMLQLLKMTEPSGEQKEYILAAIKSTKRLTRLLSDILDISRIEAGKLILEEVEFDIISQKDSVVELFAGVASRKNLDFDFFIDERIPLKLIGDEARFRQVLFNIVGNALKFTDRGFVRVDISLLPMLSSKFSVGILVAVSDTGIGIQDDRIQDVFEPFVQVEGSYIRRHQGAGLGLSIVRKLVKLMNGNLCISETDGGGTTVCYSLSLKIPAAQHLVERAVNQTYANYKKPSIRLLFAEDDEVSLISGKVMLEKSGFDVTMACNGQQTLQILKDQDFDLILMDIQMPVMDGIEATMAIRGSSSLGVKSKIPIIAMTAYAMTGDKEKFIAAGMNDYISKPVDTESLLAVIEKNLD